MRQFNSNQCFYNFYIFLLVIRKCLPNIFAFFDQMEILRLERRARTAEVASAAAAAAANGSWALPNSSQSVPDWLLHGTEPGGEVCVLFVRGHVFSFLIKTEKDISLEAACCARATTHPPGDSVVYNGKVKTIFHSSNCSLYKLYYIWTVLEQFKVK